MTKYCLVWILTIFLILQVGCQNPEEIANQDSGAIEYTLNSDSESLSDVESQDSTALESLQMDVSTGNLKGFVRDIDGNPVGQAALQIDGSNLGAATVLDGSYVLYRIPTGSQRLIVTAPGHAKELPVEILPDSTIEFNIIL